MDLVYSTHGLSPFQVVFINSVNFFIEVKL